MSDSLARFQARRIAALVGLLLPASSLLFAFLNEKVAFVSPALAWGLFGVSVLLCALALARYRCPFCGRSPEAEIPLFNPARCCECGAALRSEVVS
jgi:hypothetical protein